MQSHFYFRRGGGTPRQGVVTPPCYDYRSVM